MDDTFSAEHIALVFTDIVSSTQLKIRYPGHYWNAKEQHDTLIRSLVENYHGTEINTEGDNFFLTFPKAYFTARWAEEVQRELLRMRWLMPEPIKVRIGLHFGTPRQIVHPNGRVDYADAAVDFAARVQSSAEPGTIFVSQEFYDALCNETSEAFLWRIVRRSLKGIGEQTLYQLIPRDLLPHPSLPEPTSAMPPSYLPFIRNANFCGRQGALEELHQRLNLPNRPTIALFGMGGVGKTQLAVQYAHLHRRDYPGGVYWLDARSESILLSSYVKIGEMMFGEMKHLHAAVIAERVQTELQTRTQPTLLIFDNIVDPRILDWLPTADECRLLLTTQLRSLSAGIRMFPVRCFREEDSLELLEFYCEIGDDPAEQAAARTIVRTVGNLPLAVAMAAHHVSELGCSYSDYAPRLKAKVQTTLKQAQQRFRSETGHRVSIFNTIELAVRGKNETGETGQGLDANALRTLTTAACFAPNAIPNELLHKATGIEDQDDFEETLRVLGGRSLLLYEQNQTLRNHIALHELIRFYAQDNLLALEEHKDIVARVMGVLTGTLKRANETMEWAAVRGYVGHCYSVVALASATESPPEGLEALLSEMIPFLTEIRDYPNALKYAAQGLELAETLHSRNSLTYAHFLRLIGETYQEKGEKQKALAAVRQGWRLARRLLATGDVALAEYANSVGYVLKKQDKFRAALYFYEQAFEIYGGRNDISTVKVYNNLGTVLEALKRFQEAREHFEKGIAIQNRVGQNVMSFVLLNNLGRILGEEKRWDEALPLHKEAREIAERIQGARHPDVGSCHFYIGEVQAHLGQRDAALENYTEALHCFKQAANAEDYAFQIKKVEERLAALNVDNH